MHAVPVEGNFTQESDQAIKPHLVEDYIHSWGLWTIQTEWSAATELPAEHGSGP
jgi:hypothetical protein